VDAWNVVPLSDFTDSIFHRTPDGEEILAALLKDKIIGLACTR
jgi:hypothetical protein